MQNRSFFGIEMNIRLSEVVAISIKKIVKQ